MTDPTEAAIPPIVVIGPSGCGKSTLGLALAGALRWRFVEGDDHHPAANIAKMAAGIPLTDADRAPFLESLAGEIVRAGGRVVASCSALRRAYRDRLRARCPGIVFVTIELAAADLAARLAERRGHFMPLSLLRDQLATFEPPERGERFVSVPGRASLAVQVRTVLDALGVTPSGRDGT